MMFTGASDINLQATLSAANPPTEMTVSVVHHPLSCRDDLLWLDEDGRFGCSHAQVPADDPRTRGAIDQSIAILLLELAVAREEAPRVPG